MSAMAESGRRKPGLWASELCHERTFHRATGNVSRWPNPERPLSSARRQQADVPSRNFDGGCRPTGGIQLANVRFPKAVVLDSESSVLVPGSDGITWWLVG